MAPVEDRSSGSEQANPQADPAGADLLAIQRSAGNRATRRVVAQRSARRSATVSRAEGGAATTSTAETASWTAPFDIGQVTTYIAAHFGLRTTRRKLLEIMHAMEGGRLDGEELEAFSGLVGMRQRADELATRFEDQVPEDALSSADAEQLDDLTAEIDRFLPVALERVRQKRLDELQALENAQALEESAIAESMHSAFMEGSEDQLDQLVDLMGAVKGYNAELRRALQALSLVTETVRGAESFPQLAALTGALGPVISRIHSAARLGRSVVRIAGGHDTSGGEAHQHFDRLDAALDAFDVAAPLVTAVPLFGVLWTNYYLPAAQQCTVALRRLSTQVGRRTQDIQAMDSERWNSSHRAPTLGPHEVGAFPGGQPVFDVMWEASAGRRTPISEDAARFFGQRRDLFNVGERSVGLETEAEGWFWGREHRGTNVLGYLLANIDTVWPMLYGSLPRPTASTNR